MKNCVIKLKQFIQPDEDCAIQCYSVAQSNQLELNWQLGHLTVKFGDFSRKLFWSTCSISGGGFDIKVTREKRPSLTDYKRKSWTFLSNQIHGPIIVIKVLKKWQRGLIMKIWQRWAQFIKVENSHKVIIK